MRAVGISDVGRHRKNNEDAYYIHLDNQLGSGNIYIVADGMGGCNSGEVASSYAIESFLESFYDEKAKSEEILDRLAGALIAANQAVYNKSNSSREFAEMGTTVVAAAIRDGKLYIVYVGDSRAYLIRNKEIVPLTTDHSYVMELVKLGSITREEAATHPKRNIITRAVGLNKTVEVDAVVQDVQKDDMLLLCTDGLTGMLKDSEILEIILKRTAFEKKAQRLLEAANNRGGYDNISLILVDIGGKA